MDPKQRVACGMSATFNAILYSGCELAGLATKLDKTHPRTRLHEKCLYFKEEMKRDFKKATSESPSDGSS